MCNTYDVIVPTRLIVLLIYWLQMRKEQVIKTISKNLKKARLAQHLTQAEVAEKAGITSDHYARIERGEAAPSIVTMVTLAKSLKTRLSEIAPF